MNPVLQKRSFETNSSGRIAAALSLLLLVASCGGYPLRADDAVGRDFRNGNISPRLNYYFLGSAREPEVIIGVDRDLVLQNSLMWQPLSPLTPGHLSDLAQMMYYRRQSETTQVLGYNMFDNTGRWVGQWYSPANLTTDVYRRGPDGIFVSPPSPNPPRPLNVPWAPPPGQYW